VKEDERGGQGHTSASLLYQSATWPALWSHIVITRVLFLLRVSLCLRWMAKLSNMYASSFAWSSVNPLLKPLKCLLRLLRIFFKLHNVFLMAFTFQGQLSVSWRWEMFTVPKHQQNYRRCWRSLRAHPWRPSPNSPWARRHHWDQL
jgi:hypothetical protein